MGDKTKKVERKSQATPHAQSFLSKLRKQLDSDAFGTGTGPLQRQAGDAAGKLLGFLQGYKPDLDGNFDDYIKKTQAGGGESFTDLLSGIQDFDTSVFASENAAQTKGVKGFEALGGRLGGFGENLAALMASGGFDINAKQNAAQTRGVSGFGDLESQIAALISSGGLDVNAKQTTAQTRGVEGFGNLDSQLAELLASGGLDVNAKQTTAQTRGVEGFGELDAQIAELLASGGLDVNTGEAGQQNKGASNINRLISSLFGGAEGGTSTGNERLIEGLTKGSKARTGRSVADLREQSGILGNRFGTSLASGEALLRSESDAELDKTIGAILEQGRQFDTDQLTEAVIEQFSQGTSLRDQEFRNEQTSQENRFRGRDQRTDVLSSLFGSGTELRDQDFRNQQTSQENRFRGRDQRTDILSRLFGSGTTLRDQDFRNQQTSQENRFRGRDQRTDVLSRLFGSGTTLRDQDFRNQDATQASRDRGRGRQLQTFDQESSVLAQLFGAGSTLRDQEFRNEQSSVQNELQRFSLESGATRDMNADERDRLRIEGDALNAEFNQKLAKERFNLDLNDQQINVIKVLHQQGMANEGVFERMAALGILPEEIIRSKSFWGYMGDLGTAAVTVGTKALLPTP